MIRFSAGLVVVAIGVLIGGIATSRLLLVYVAIGLSAVALLALAIGVVLKREELFGEQRQAPPVDASAGEPSIRPNGAVDALAARVAAPAAFGTAYPGSDGAADRAAPPSFGQPSAPGHGGFGQPGRTGPQGREALSGRDAPPARDWPGRVSAGTGQAGQDASRPGRPAGSFRQDIPWPPAATPAAAAPGPPSTRPAAPASPGAPSSPVPPWRERLSPSYGDPFGSTAATRPGSGSPDSASSPAPSWFDRPARPARDTAAETGEKSPRVSAETETPAAATAAPQDDDASGRAGTASEHTFSAAGPAPRDGEPGDGEPAVSVPEESSPMTATTPSATAPEAADDAPEGAEPAPGTAAPRPDEAVGTDKASETDRADAAAEASRADEADAAGHAASSGEQRDGGPPATRGSDSKQVTVIPGVPRYHNENCILIRFMADEDVQQMTVREATESGCTPCRACQPDLADA